MQAQKEPVYFIHMSDTHIGPTRDYQLHGYQSWPAAKRAVELIRTFTHRPDFVIHTGDVVTDPDPVSYQIAAELLGELDIPLYFAVGNHDTARDIKRFLPHGPHEPLGEDPERHIYTFWVKGCEFMVLDGRAADELDPQGWLGDPQLDLLREKVSEDGEAPLTIFVHFPAFPLNSPWFDKNMLLIDGSKLHDVLIGGRRPIRGVFHGHIHMPLHTLRDGLLYSSAASTFANFAAWPNVNEPVFLDEQPGFTFVQQLANQSLIRHHVFERP
ncbi:MAG: metallophosphoesterase [Ardenticatenaceae bacterium]|nr:metallophosphoesterase [Ardenticatenaceae bacterium]